MRPLLFAGAVTVLALANATASATLHVRIDGNGATAQTLELNDSARLSNAALAAHLSPQVYLLGAAWLRPSAKPSQRRLKTGVLFDLGQLQLQALKHEDSDLGRLADSLHRWITSLPVTGRIPALLDPRAVEVNAPANLPVGDGDVLYYPTRPDHVRVVGAVTGACAPKLQPLRDARFYLSSCPPSRLADKDWIYVIEPDGRITRVGVSLWNRSSPLALAPGSLVYVPLREQLARSVDRSLNDDLAAFLATQILPGPEVLP